MKSKKHPGKQIADITKPRKQTAEPAAPSAPELIIPKRTVILPETMLSTPDSEHPVKTRPEGRSIQPDSAAGDESSEPEPPEDKAPVPADTEPAAEPEVRPAEAEPDTAPEPAVENTEPPEDDGEDAGEKPPKSDQHVRKALEEAKRQQEIQGFIENRDFFVPINALARKRSLKVTVFLTMLEFMLGLFLLNLMLDAGLIQLIEKIPHTNFFDI